MLDVVSDLNGDGRSDLVIAPWIQQGSVTSAGALIGFVSANSDGGETFTFDAPSTYPSTPVARGDFNGDGLDEVVSRNPQTGDWNYVARVWDGTAWVSMSAGGPSSTDFAVDGAGQFGAGRTSGVLFRNETTGDWGYMTAAPFAQEVWHAVGSSSPGYAVIGVGDFNGDGRSDVAFRNKTTGDWGYMSLDSSGANEVWHTAGPSSTDYRAVGVGDFDGNGIDDVAFRNDVTGDWGYMSTSASGGEVWHPVGGSAPSYAAVAVGDYNGDGRADIAFRQGSPGFVSNGPGSTTLAGFNPDWGYMSANPGGGETWHGVQGPSPSAAAVAVGRFGSSSADMVFARDASGQLAYITFGDGPFTWHPMGASSTDYVPVGSQDFNHDGTPDLAFVSRTTGDLGYMSPDLHGGEVWHEVGSTSTAYTPLAVGDFNGDGVGDVLFRNTASGDWGYMSVLPAGGEAWHAVGPSSTGYAFIGVGNFDGQGPEVAFRSTSTGDWGYMSFNPDGSEAWHAVGATSLSYDAVGVGDIDGDGRSDIAFLSRQGVSSDLGYMSVTPGGGETWHDGSIFPGSAPWYNVTSLVLADVNGDGVADLILNSPGAIAQRPFSTPIPQWEGTPAQTDYFF